ncbi:unnamed protein product, partial [marine sediment metagenome]
PAIQSVMPASATNMSADASSYAKLEPQKIQ